MFLFFFSSRRRHTRFDCDWSSDVCSSDLWNIEMMQLTNRSKLVVKKKLNWIENLYLPAIFQGMAITISHLFRSEERRVGKECRSRLSAYHSKTKRIMAVVRHRWLIARTSY